MTQSPEFPQYRWMPPRSYTRGRVSGQPSVIVIHTTEGSEGPQSAEDGAAYDQRRTDEVSAHFYADADSAVQCVRTTDEAHTAAGRGNDIGIHIEVCGRAGQTSAQWNDAASRATIERLAGLCRTLLGKYPRIRLVDLTPGQLRSGERWAFCEHKDISLAWGQTDHTDPGPRFPWARLFDLIREEGDMSWSERLPETSSTKARFGAGTKPASTYLLLAAIHAFDAAQAAQATLRAAAGDSADAVLAEIRAQGEQTRAALLAAVTEQAPALAGAVVDRLGTEVTAAEIGEALAQELAAMLAGATAGE
jgi:N-acetyl-anhydromuramyl-L-alanine amidase AmpD